jgi:hypothetical protein
MLHESHDAAPTSSPAQWGNTRYVIAACAGCGSQWGPASPLPDESQRLCGACARERRGLPRYRPLVRVPSGRDEIETIQNQYGEVVYTNRLDR